MHAKTAPTERRPGRTINRSRLRRPADSPGSIQRANLAVVRERIEHARLTVLAAPAGYGKTTLMAQLATGLCDSGQSNCWFTPDTCANRPATVLGYLAGMLDELLPGIACEGSPDILLAQVCNAIDECSQPLYIFVDDLHVLPKDSAELIMRLVEVAPTNAHFIVSTRSVAGLSLARLRARGALFELGVPQLAFDQSESSEVITTHRLPADTVAELCHRAAGWPAGLGLLLQAVDSANSTGPRAGPPQNLRAINDYFAEEVYSALDTADQRFLRRISILDRLCAPLCDEVAEVKDSLTRLKRLSLSGYFLRSIDEDWYDFHPMFGEFLRGVLEETESTRVPDMHRRASIWLGQAGKLVAALEHAARSQDFDHLAQFLEANCEEMTYQGDIPVVARYANALPEQVLDGLPRTLMTLAWLYTRQLRFDETHRLLKRVARRIDDMEAAGETPESDTAMLRLMLEHRQTVLATAKDEEMSYVDEQSENLIRQFGDTQPYITCTLYSQMLTARYSQFRLADFSRIEPNARTALERSPYRFAGISLQATLGTGLFLAGRTQAARDALEHSLDEANRMSGAKSGQAALAALPLARLLYECDERGAAETLIADHLPAARQFGFSEQLHCGYLTLNRLRQADNDVEGALQVLEEGRRVADECSLERLRIGVTSERIRIWLRQGRADLASREGQREGLDVPPEDIWPSARSSQRDELRAIAWVRLATSHDRLADALKVAKRWRHFCGSRGVIRALVRWCILGTQVNAAQGDMVAAKRCLHAALSYGTSGRFIRSFIDEGPFVQQLIEETYGGTVRSEDPVEFFARDLLARYPGENKPDTTDGERSVEAFISLTAREVAILNLVGRGLHNGEIGSRLGLTEGTVKWYMQQIYDKVGVRRRPQAVERARQLGLLN